MAILKIARMGNPVLTRPAEPVADPTAPEIRALVADMVETMADAFGTGLAAPQVHVPLRIVVFFVSEARVDPDDSDDVPVPLTVLINPEIEVLDDETETDWEGCLSMPGLTGRVPRARRVRYRAQTPEGGTIEREASGFHARVVQHECDHLEGILYPMRMTDLSELAFVDEMNAARARAQAAARTESDAEDGADADTA